MATPVVDPTFYADFGGLSALKRDVKANDPQAIREAARQFESLFTEMMLKSMREAKLGQGLGDSDQTDFYQDMYDQQLSLEISQGKGLGLADMLVQQLTRRGLIKGAAAGSTSAGTTSAGAAPTGAARAATTPTGTTPTGTTSTGAARAAGPGALTDRQRIGFIRAMTPYAQRAGAALGVSPDSIIGQAALETGWGRHVPAGTGGASSHNLFGVKVGADWSGASVSAETTEYRAGAPAAQTQSFRAYSSLQQGVNDYVTLLRRQPAYQAALGTGDDVAAFAAGLQRGGYATDPDYVQKLSATVASVRTLRTAGAAALDSATLKLRTGGPISAGTITAGPTAAGPTAAGPTAAGSAPGGSISGGPPGGGAEPV